MQTMTILNPNAPVTNKTLGQSVETIIHGVERMFKAQNKLLDKRFNTIETDVRDIRRRMIDHEVDTPTKKEFNELKSRID